MAPPPGAGRPRAVLDDLLEGLPSTRRLGQEALAGHLREARAVLAAAPHLAPVPAAAATATPAALPPELERLRDFHLPPVPAPAG